jgi:hypothetical protein
MTLAYSRWSLGRALIDATSGKIDVIPVENSSPLDMLLIVS